ncbi:MAG: hypothetical protein A2Y10_20515 [Planctomycetes bacterium GWF2_41_51]|nr:MAG: hypothetical protein A2Y10_20515 [Planctomycetes bacterium GWF2_41_51]HBG25702.1 hypothetical protein [Phycisphaerales bacterium]
MKFFIIYLIGFFVLIKIISLIGALRMMLKLRFKKGNCTLCEAADVPDYLKNLFDEYAAKLNELGFEFSHYQIAEEFVISEYSKRIIAVYFNPSIMCYAEMQSSMLINQNAPVKFAFVSLFSDGYSLYTLNCSAHDLFGEIPNTTLIDPYSPTIEGQFQAHLEEHNKLKRQKQLITPSAEKFAAAEKTLMNEYFESLKIQGFIKPADEQYFQMRFIPAIKCILQYIKGANKVKKSGINKLSKPVNVPVEAESEAFFKMQDILKSGKTGFIGSIAVFLISLLVFIFAFKIKFSFEVIFIMIGVLLIHELGHYIMMRLFKYKDVHILFMPFGAATFGSESKATVLQKITVYLMGPAPGIIIGACLVMLSRNRGDILMQFGIFMLILNYINLIPIMPLDGGRVFELALFSKVPFLKNAFSVLSIIVLVLAGIHFADPILFIISVSLCAGVFSGIQQNRLMAELKRKIRDENIELKDEILVPSIFNMLKVKPFDRQPFRKKIETVKYLLKNSTTELPTTGTTVISLLMYLGVLLLPVFAAINVIIGRIIMGMFRT